MSKVRKSVHKTGHQADFRVFSRFDHVIDLKSISGLDFRNLRELVARLDHKRKWINFSTYEKHKRDHNSCLISRTVNLNNEYSRLI